MTRMSGSMKSNIKKWGNSHGAIIPAAAMKVSGISLGDDVDVIAEKGQITFRPARPKYTLDGLLAASPVKAPRKSKEEKAFMNAKTVGREFK